MVTAITFHVRLSVAAATAALTARATAGAAMKHSSFGQKRTDTPAGSRASALRSYCNNRLSVISISY